MAPKKSSKCTKSAASADDDNVGHHAWTVEEEDLLIDLWEENDLLYHLKKTRGVTRARRERVFIAIGKELGVDGKFCRFYFGFVFKSIS